MLTAFDLIAILLVLTATFAWINHRFIGLPHSIGLLVMGLGDSLALIGVELAICNKEAYRTSPHANSHGFDWRERFVPRIVIPAVIIAVLLARTFYL